MDNTARTITASGEYDRMCSDRDPFLRRARDCAKLTIPSLLPEDGHSGATTLYQPYQSTGSDGVNNLAAKLLLTLFPPGETFVRFKVDDFVLEELEGAGARGEVEQALSRVERSIADELEKGGARQVLFEALQHLIVTGNGLLHINKENKLQFFPLDRYVVKRDREGNVLHIIVKETLSRLALPPKIQEMLTEEESWDPHKKSTEEVDLYTWIQRQPNGSWTIHQEVGSMVVEGSNGSYPKDKCPWLPLRWKSVSGEDYGRGRCEEYYGDLYSLESATKSIVTFGAIAAKVIFLCNAGGVTDPEELAEAESGDILEGDANDVTQLRVEKVADFQIVNQVKEDCKSRLERAFLLASSVQRNAERVTAEEIRIMVGELEQNLGGAYSIQAEELQRPLAIIIYTNKSRKKELPKLPEGIVSPQIVTGLDGLGRNADMQKLDLLLMGIAESFGHEALAGVIKLDEYILRRAASLGVDITGLVKTPEEQAAEQNQAQMMAMAQAAVGPGINAAAKVATAPQQQTTSNMEAG